jgi:1-acyl-sn-glycerol-3-phosphate acyltransferase
MLQALAKTILRVNGWQLVGEIPNIKKAVFIAAPHTSNWDGLWFIVYKFAVDVEVRFLGKHSLFWWPLGSILSALGCMPVDRGAAADVVRQLVEAFEGEDRMFLALAPEGTRKWTPHWKTGFYRIAKAAGVPIYLAFIDYREKKIGIGPALPSADDMEEDVAFMRDFYTRLTGRRPELQGPVSFPPGEFPPTR